MKQFGVINLLILVYLLMSLVSLIIEFSDIFPSVFPYKFTPMAYLSLCFMIVFSGFFCFKDQAFTHIKIENFKVYKWLENIVMLGGYISIIFFLPFAITSLSGDVEVNRLTTAIFQQTVLAQYGIFNTLFSLFSNLFILTIFFAFLNFTDQDNKRKKIKGYLLLISSFSYVVYVLAYVGRDGIVYWSLTYLFIYLLLKKFISSSIRKKLLYSYLIVVGLLIIPFMIISVARFSETVGGVSWQLLDYAGQQIKNFNDSFYVESPLLNGQFSYPIFSDLFRFIGFNFERLKVEDIFPYYLSYGVDPWIFKTFIGEYIMDFGKIGTLVFLVIFYFVVKTNLKKVSAEGTFSFSSLIFFILFYQMILWGVFYFRFYSMNLYIIIMVMLAFAFRSLSKSSEERIITPIVN